MDLPNETLQAGPVTKTQNVLVSYISNLFFTFTALVIFLGSVITFHIYFNPMSWIVFLIELLIVSFGTHWCILSFLKIITETPVKKSHALHQETTGQSNRVLSHSGHVNIATRILKIVRNIINRLGIVVQKRLISYCLCSLIIFGVLCGGASFAEIVQENADDVLLLACELLCETGPDFPESINRNNLLNILSSYSKYLEEKRIPAFLKPFTDSPAKGIITAKKMVTDIQDSKEQKKVANAIWQAGEEIMLGQFNALKFLPIRTPLHKHGPVPDWLLEEIRTALLQSKDALEEAKKAPTLKNKLNLCEANRASMLLLFLARNSIYDDLLTEFHEIVESSKKDINVEIDPAMIDKNGVDMAAKIQEFSDIIDRSENRRSMILAAILAHNMTTATDYMWDAMHESYLRRENLLVLTEVLR